MVSDLQSAQFLLITDHLVCSQSPSCLLKTWSSLSSYLRDLPLPPPWSLHCCLLPTLLTRPSALLDWTKDRPPRCPLGWTLQAEGCGQATAGSTPCPLLHPRHPALCSQTGVVGVGQAERQRRCSPRWGGMKFVDVAGCWRWIHRGDVGTLASPHPSDLWSWTCAQSPAGEEAQYLMVKAQFLH